MHVISDPARAYPHFFDSTAIDDDGETISEDIVWNLGPVLTSADIDIIALGRKAGRDGEPAGLCPYERTSREADLWHFGREAA